MYLQRMELKNTGPIESVNIEFTFNNDGSPKPIIFVGKNGSGKSIATAHVVSALIYAHGIIYEDSDVEKNRVYKIRSPVYVRRGTLYSTGEIFFSNNFSVHEAQFSKLKKQHAEPFPNYTKWDEVQPNESSHFYSNFPDRADDLKEDLDKLTYMFFPPNRFEEPAWLNEMNLRNKTSYSSLQKFTNLSNRPIISYAPMRDLQSWLLDLIYNSYAVERVTQLQDYPLFGNQLTAPRLIEVRNGEASVILEVVSKFILALFGKQGTVKWDIGARNGRKIGFSINNDAITNNLFQLSTGQAVLLDLFLAIIRDFDLSDSKLTQLSDIEGIVIVDEIDIHLHTDLQHDVLPSLIRLFPKVQFILTTHSPLFLIGMEKAFTPTGFQIINLPDGHEIEVERFSEFESAYNHMQSSARFQQDVRSRVAAGQKPVVYLEGTTDINYLTRAAELLERTALVEKFELLDAGGYSNLNSIWSTYKSHLHVNIKHKCLLLYDCDVNKEAKNCGNLFSRTIARHDHNITSGIENLFSDETIQKAIEHKLEFVDITEEHETIGRGVKKVIPERWEINKDEKRNLCDWLCANGDAKDFKNFKTVFDILEEVLQFGEN